MKHKDLKSLETHFAFGENWKSFASGLGEEGRDLATASLHKLFPGGELVRANFFDIGSGSGLHMVAARALGAGDVQGIDIDPASVEASHAVLSRFLPDGGWSVRRKSVFDLTPAEDGLHDVVYSWGVLHHTGEMWGAVERAASLVRPGGYFAIALYRKSPFCGAWGVIKRLYASGGPVVQTLMRAVYKPAYLLGLMATGRNPFRYLREYRLNRGMDWHHDVHDWMGGHPYESAAPEEVVDFLEKLGFTLERSFTKPAAAFGFFGTHCDEFVARRPADL